MTTKLPGYDTTIIFGVIEDVNDPEQLNRVRIRLPYHGSKGDTPTNMLPWARTTSPAMGVGPNQGGGGGQGGLSAANGATVMALVNQDNHEDLTVLGVLPTNSTGKDVVGASAGGQSSMALGGLKGAQTGGKFEPPTDMSKGILSPSPPAFPQNKGKYPDTFVNVSKGGMRNILHDVNGEVFQASVHPTGTFQEMQADGNYVTYTAKDRKEAVDGQYTLGSQGNMVIATNGNLQLKVKGNMLVEVEGRYEEYTAGLRVIKVGGNMDVGVKGQAVIIGEKAATLESPASTFVTGVGALQLNKGSRMGAVPGLSASNPTADAIKSGIEDGSYAKTFASN